VSYLLSRLGGEASGNRRKNVERLGAGREVEERCVKGRLERENEGKGRTDETWRKRRKNQRGEVLRQS
jgi:hypothetical protein